MDIDLKHCKYTYEAMEKGVEKALQVVKALLENQRNPCLSSKVPHTYNDKYILSTFLTNNAISSLLFTLGFTSNNDNNNSINNNIFKQLKDWSLKRSVTLRFRVSEECKFLKKEIREETYGKDVCSYPNNIISYCN